MFPWLTVIYQQLPCLSPLRCFRMLRTTLLPDSAVGHRLPSFSLGKAAWQHAVQLNGAGPRHFELNSCWDAEAQPFHWCLSLVRPPPPIPNFPPITLYGATVANWKKDLTPSDPPGSLQGGPCLINWQRVATRSLAWVTIVCFGHTALPSTPHTHYLTIQQPHIMKLVK